MSDDPPQPDWQRLPHDPHGFFDLPNDYDRKQLKRSYNRLIRCFKPETHPEEFQRIRAAYEQLDRVLRYGGGLDVRGDLREAFSDAWPTSVGQEPTSQSPTADQSATGQPSSGQPAPSPLPLELHERLDNETPADLYLELQNKPEKQAYDYYALALLADVCDRRDGMQFVRWLLHGIKAHPHEAALKWLLQAFFRGPMAEGSAAKKALPKLLVAAAQAIGDDAFYPVTEPGWDTLLRSGSLDAFVKTLKQCQAHLREIGIAGKVAFSIRMLRTAFWKRQGATPQAQAWTDETMDFIESNFEQVPGELDFEVDLLAMVHNYLPLRQAFVGGSELRRRLDQALETFFTSEQVAGDRAIVEMHLSLAHDASVLVGAFPVDQEEEAVDAFYSTWAWVGYEVEQRCGVDNEEPDIDLWNGRAHALLVQLEAKSDSSMVGQLWNWSGLFLRMLQVGCYVFAGLAGFLSLFFPSLLAMEMLAADNKNFVVLAGLVSSAAAGTAGFFGGRWLSTRLIERFYTPFCHRMARRSYHALWRREAFGMLNRSRLPYTLFRDLINHQATTQISTSQWVSHYISQDYGLAIYAMALKHVV